MRHRHISARARRGLAERAVVAAIDWTSLANVAALLGVLGGIARLSAELGRLRVNDGAGSGLGSVRTAFFGAGSPHRPGSQYAVHRAFVRVAGLAVGSVQASRATELDIDGHGASANLAAAAARL